MAVLKATAGPAETVDQQFYIQKKKKLLSKMTTAYIHTENKKV